MYFMSLACRNAIQLTLRNIHYITDIHLRGTVKIIRILTINFHNCSQNDGSVSESCELTVKTAPRLESEQEAADEGTFSQQSSTDSGMCIY